MVCFLFICLFCFVFQRRSASRTLLKRFFFVCYSVFFCISISYLFPTLYSLFSILYSLSSTLYIISQKAFFARLNRLKECCSPLIDYTAFRRTLFPPQGGFLKRIVFTICTNDGLKKPFCVPIGTKCW